ncbi:hypothetical protein OsJ_17724 [Oryza sativa Japonica Group]|uniref:Uncharacterized protein n=1 Tax=Oryza sativa subsp. japonica TaxID=39947 RepID=B9FJF1_ORYSJ|nr:hypothetical protein OsJ_17724 [Oryza sativa Japonica Group]
MNGIELSSGDKAKLVETLKNKLQALAEQHVDMLESLAPAVRKRVDVLMEIQRSKIVSGVLEVEGETEEREEKGVPDFWLNAMKKNEILAEEVLTKESSESTKPITKTEECESFFNFFSPPQVPDDDAKNDEYTLAHVARSTLRDKIIPHAVSWFTREAVQDEDYGASWVDDEEEDDDDDEYSDEEA